MNCGGGWCKRVIVGVILLLSIWVFVQTTIWCLTINGRWRDLDFVQFWTAANCCVTGGNPYNSGHFTERLLSVAPARHKVPGWAYTPAFVYAPNILPFLAPLGVLDLDTAAWVWRMANICALLIGLRFAILWLAPNASLNQKMLMLAFAITLSPVITALYIGQSPLLVLCGMAIAGYSVEKSRPYLGGFGLMLGLLKPHMMLVFLLYVLLRRRFKMFFVGATLSIAAFLGGLLLIHDSPASVLNMFPVYRNCRANQPASDAVLSFYGILAQVGNLSTADSLLIGAIAGIVLVGVWTATEWRKGPSPDALSIPVVVLATLTFANTHKFDAVLLILFIVVLVAEMSTRLRVWHVPCLAGLFLLTVPVWRLISLFSARLGSLLQTAMGEYSGDRLVVAALFVIVALRYAITVFRPPRPAGFTERAEGKPLNPLHAKGAFQETGSDHAACAE